MNEQYSKSRLWLYFLFLQTNKNSVFLHTKNTISLSTDGIPPDFASDLSLEIVELPATSGPETGLMEYWLGTVNSKSFVGKVLL